MNGDGNRYRVARGDVAAATVDLDGLLEEARWGLVLVLVLVL